MWEDLNRPKVAWGEGPWRREPDRLEWVDEETGFRCLLRRNGQGAWCGYVGVEAGHVLHGSKGDRGWSVHGSVTFTGPMCGSDSIEIMTASLDPETWWFGFDCSHWQDYGPKTRQGDPGGYKDLGFVRCECKNLAAQIAGRVVDEEDD
jgi:hypothetical protein